MRILLVNDQLSAEGGSEVFLHSIMAALKQRGHVVRLCVARILSDASGFWTDTDVIQIPWHGVREASDRRSGVQVQGAAVDFQPDVVYAHNVFDANVIKSLQGSWPLIWHSHDHRVHCLNGNRRYPRSGDCCDLPMGFTCIRHAFTERCGCGARYKTLVLLRRRQTLIAALRRAERIVVFGQYLKDTLLANGFPPARVLIIPPLTRYADLSAPPAYPVESGGAHRKVLFAGRLVADKGVDDVLWLGRMLVESGRKARLVVAGPGPLLPRILDASHRPDSGIEYKGVVNAGALSQLFAESSVVVIPSRWPEPFGLTGLEALAHARPVVAYRAGGIADWLIDGVTGILVNIGDREALGAAVFQLLDNASAAAEMGIAGASVIRRKYDASTALEALENAFKAAITEKSNHRPQPRRSSGRTR